MARTLLCIAALVFVFLGTIFWERGEFALPRVIKGNVGAWGGEEKRGGCCKTRNGKSISGLKDCTG